MDIKFPRQLKSLRNKLISTKMSVNDIMELAPSFQSYAKKVLDEESVGVYSTDIVKSLEDFLMICLDVYTYSENGESLIPDYTYDRVMNVFCDLFERERLSYSDYIASTMLWPFVEHEAPFMVGTINRKIYDVNTLDMFLQQYVRDGYQHILYAPKFDGISAAVTIRNGNIEQAVTRNDGVKGQDITEVIRRMNKAKKIFTKETTPDGYYKCELVVTTDDFANLVQLKPYKNRRSAASAIVQSPSNLIYTEFLTAIPLAWVNFNGTQMRYLASQYGEKYVSDTNNFSTDVVYENIERLLHHIRSAEYPVRVDGVVLFPIRGNQDEPNTTDLMANCLAYKVNTQEGITRVKSAYMSIGRLGLAKPMVLMEPVEVNEVYMQRATPGSMAQFASMNLHEGEEIVVFAAGDVIPQIRLPDPRSYPKNAPRLTIDLHCPYCGRKLRPKPVSDANLYCLNPRCPRVLAGRISNFLEKLEIAEGFRDNTFFTLVQEKVVQTIDDLFFLNKKVEMITRVLGSRLEAEKLIKGLYDLRSKTFEVSQVIGSLGIDGISIKTCQKIFREVELDELLEMKKNRIYLELMNIDLVGPATAEIMADWINENRDFIEFLLQHMKIVPDRIVYGTVVFTGFRNKEYSDAFKELGFPVADSVTNGTVCVVYSGDTTTHNAKRAISKNIPLVHLSQIDNLLAELKARVIDLSNKDIRYGIPSLIKDIRRHIECYRDI